MTPKLLILDVDGVLTDGRFWLPPEGGEWKAFHSADGLGLRLLMNAGVAVALLSGRDSPCVDRRARELGVQAVLQGRRDKVVALEELCERFGAGLDEVAYMGDDLVDLPAMRRVGLAAAPADGRPEVLEAAHWVAASPGGRGAVRDLCEHLLREAGRWEDAVAGFDR